MTSGVSETDHRVGVTGTMGATQVGYYYRKTWNGTDKSVKRPRSRIQYSLPRDPVSNRIVWRWAKVPNVPPKRASNEDHPYHCDIYRFEEPSLAAYHFDNHLPPPFHVTDSGTGSFKYNMTGGIRTSSLWTPNDDIQLINKLKTAILGSDFDLGIFLGEGREALKMIATAATKISKAMLQAKKGNFFGAAQTLIGASNPRIPLRKVPARNWLELQYGWLPLLQDAHGAATMLGHHLSTPLQVKVRVRRRVSEYPVLTQSSTARYQAGWRYSFGQILYKVKEVDVPQLIGLTNPSTVLWEITPWSFVADWFLPIGSWLAARGVSQALTGTFVITKGTDVMGAGPVSAHPDYEYTADSRERWLIFDRNVTNNLGSYVPLPSIKPLEKAASWKHCVNAVALLASQDFRRKIA